MPSIKPTPPLTLAYGNVSWAGDAERFVRQRESGAALTSIDHQQLNDALLVFNDLLPRVETLLARAKEKQS